MRDSCGVGAVSAWVTIPFTTLAASGTVLYAGPEFSITAVPNPVKDVLNIYITGGLHGDAQILLTDITGKLIQSLNVASNVQNIDLSNVPSGIYLIRYTDAEHTQTLKVNKQ